MSGTTPCGRCGNPVPRMRVPDEWDSHTVAGWRSLEERFVCADCEQLVVAWADSFSRPVPWPTFVLLPRLERARIAACSARTRVRAAWRALRDGDSTQSEWEADR